MPPGTYAVVLSASPQTLLETSEQLKALGVHHAAIVEQEGTYAGEITAIGVKPERRSKLRKLFSSLPLLR